MLKKEDINVKFKFNKEIPTLGSYQDVLNKRKQLKDLQTKVKSLEKAYNKAKEEKSLESVTDFSQFTFENKIIGQVEGIVGNALKQLVDDLASQHENGFVLLASVLPSKVIFVCKSNDPTVNAGKMVKEAAIICNGNGGGRPDFAQAGGKDPSKVTEALDKIKELVL